MGLLDDNIPKDVTASAFTVTLASGDTWSTPVDQRYRYSIEAGVLSVYPIAVDGAQLPGVRHYSPTGWSDLIEHDPSTTPEVHGVANLRV